MGNQPSQEKTEKRLSIKNASSNTLSSTTVSHGTPQPIRLSPASSLTPPRCLSGRVSLGSSPLPQTQQSVRLIIHNGITGTYISSQICAIAFRFYTENVEPLSVENRLEIGCSILFAMSSYSKTKQILQNNAASKPIKQLGLRYLEMVAWLLRRLVTNNIDLHSLLSNIGAWHQNIGIRINFFPSMLQALNETFAYYFPIRYTIDVKYALDEIFCLVAQVMSGQELQSDTYLMAISNQFGGGNIAFLRNVSTCLESNIGREYLFRYLTQSMCSEIVVFLQSLFQFKRLTSDGERFIAAKNIQEMSIQNTAEFCLNLSYETRQNTLQRIKDLKPIKIDKDFFAEVEYEILKLMMHQWTHFSQKIKRLRSRSIYPN
eukprot:170791_1